MISIFSIAKGIIQKCLNKNDLNVYLDKIEIIPSKKYGAVSSNIALQLQKELERPPRDIAAELVELMELDESPFKEVKIEGPGFINFYLDYAKTSNFVFPLINNNSNKKGVLNLIEEIDDERIMIEYSSPNIAKPLGAHHLLSTIIGQSISDILEFVGHKIERRNYLGDLGTQFGKMLLSIEKWGDIEIIKEDPIEELLKLYVKFHDEVENDKELEGEARKISKKLEDGGEEEVKMWKWIKEISVIDLKKHYKRLNIDFDVWDGESNYNQKMDAIIEEGIKLKIFYEGEKGALIADYKDDTNAEAPPVLIRRGDGGTLYATRDLASIKERGDSFSPDKVLYIVDMAQSLQLKQVFQVAHKFDWARDIDLIHVSFGRMRFKDEKISTRKGNSIRLQLLLDESEKRAYEIVSDKLNEEKEEEKKEISRIIGIGAVKYSILSQNRKSDVVFDWDKILSLDGNSAPYIQYTAIRAASILNNTDDIDINNNSWDNYVLTEEEEGIIKHILLFDYTLKSAAENYYPHEICNYLYELSKLFNSFYNKNKVLGSEYEKQRLILVQATNTVIKDGLRLLGIEIPNKM